MNSENFCYWLNGFIELNESHLELDLPTASQWNMIKEHLATVFNKITPPKEIFPKTPISIDLPKVNPGLSEWGGTYTYNYNGPPLKIIW